MRENSYRENDLKTEIKTKLNLIYYSKYKINTKWWNIKMKTRNLTQSSLGNDPINRRMHGFSFRVFSFLSRSKSDFKYSLDAEMH